jgi:multidrug efflux pump subunit AcrA (membrane-fusion protein)
MKKFKLNLIIAALGTVILLSGCGKKEEEAANTKPAVVKETKNVVEASGVVKALNSKNIVVDMPTSITVKVEGLEVKEGQNVKKGDKLVKLDLSEYNSLITQKTKSIESSQYLRKDMPTTNQKKAQDLKIATEKQELDTLKNKINQSYISEESIVCDMDNAVVSDISYKVGDVIGSAQKILTLQDLNSLVVQANIDEEFIKDVQKDKSVTIIPKSDSSLRLTGKVSRIFNSAVLQNGDTVIPVEITIDNNDKKLLPNYSVDVEISKN